MYMKLDKEISSSYIHLFIHLIFAMFLHLCYCGVNVVSNTELNSIREKMIYLVSSSLGLTASILSPLVFNNTLGISGWVCVLLCLFAFICIIYDNIVKLFKREEVEN
jgi:hypothetical protein